MTGLKKRRVFLSTALSCMCLTLVACGKGGQTETLYENGRMESFLEESSSSGERASAFASDLCVVTGSEPSSDSGVNAEAATLFSVKDKQVLFQKNPFERMNPASITKIMTALIALQDGDLKKEITVGKETVITEAGASLCHINPGETLTLEQLLYGLMLPSGNDAASAIAVYEAGSVEAFADKMNETAWKLGATDTHFVNPHGLTDPEHYTTAYDLYLIFNECLKYPEFRKIIGTTEYTAEYKDANGVAKSQKWESSNQYLTGKRETPDGVTVLGGKTGTTQAAGYCLILGCEDDQNQDYISVVMKASNRPELYGNMTNIIQKIVK